MYIYICSLLVQGCIMCDDLEFYDLEAASLEDEKQLLNLTLRVSHQVEHFPRTKGKNLPEAERTLDIM